MSETQTKVLKYARAFAIFFVVLGHTMIPSVRGERGFIFGIWTVIYIFHMPTFFFISGALYEVNNNRYKSRPVTFIKKKLGLLIVPYFSLSILIYASMKLLSFIPPIASLVNQMGYGVGSFKEACIEILTYNGHLAQHLWFVLVLFAIFIVNILLRNISTKIVCYIFILIPPIILPILKEYYVLPDILNYLIFEIPFFMIGRLSIFYRKLFDRLVKRNCSPLFFTVFVVVYLSIVINIENAFPIKWLFMLVMRFTGIASLLSISAILTKFDNNLWLHNLISIIESKSYSIYLLHQPFIVSGCAGLFYVAHVPTLIIIILATVLGLIMPLCLDRILESHAITKKLILGGR